jgi:hypothetical protein
MVIDDMFQCLIRLYTYSNLDRGEMMVKVSPFQCLIRLYTYSNRPLPPAIVLS